MKNRNTTMIKLEDKERKKSYLTLLTTFFVLSISSIIPFNDSLFFLLTVNVYLDSCLIITAAP